MRNLGLLIVVAAASAGLTGCGQVGTSGSSARGGLAVVDLDKVAADTKRDTQLAAALELRQNSLNQIYKKNVESAKEQLSEKLHGFKSNGEELSDDEKKEMAGYERNAIGQLNQLRSKAQVDFEQYKQAQIAQFRAALKPIAQEIAAKRGLSVVIPKNEGLLLSVEPGVDITDEVSKAFREKYPQPATPVAQPAPAAATQQPAAEKDAASAAADKKPAQSAKSTGSSRTADAGAGSEKNR